MTKIQVRKLKSHYRDRWWVMRHNQKNSNQLLLIEDAYVVKEVVQGRTLAWCCLGEIYHKILDNVDTSAEGLYDTILLINPIEFKYLTPHEIYDKVCKIASNHLATNGRIFCTLNHGYIIYDRVNQSLPTAFECWNDDDLKLLQMRTFFDKSRLGFGDIWLTLARD